VVFVGRSGVSKKERKAPQFVLLCNIKAYGYGGRSTENSENGEARETIPGLSILVFADVQVFLLKVSLLVFSIF
jgi:hypothetical protein